MTTSAANPWLTAMGLPQWQLRGGVVEVAETIFIKEPDADTAPVVVQPTAIVEPAMIEPVVKESIALNKTEPVVQSPTVNQPVEPATVAPASAPAEQFKSVPLLVIWDELQEQAVAGAGSMPSGELGDLLANIVLAVGLTEDVVEAWSTPPEDIDVLLLARQLAPRSVWQFSTGKAVQHQSVQIGAGQHAVEMISAPSLRELQAQKPLKVQLWHLLKPLADAGLWR